MKNYLPIVIGVLVLAVAVTFARQYAMRTSVTSVTSGKDAQITPSEELSGIPTAAAKDDVSAVSGITLTISTPSNNATVSSGSLTVKGKTVAGAEVFVNDLETKADASGNFSATMTLEEGDNYILIVANDAAGNYSEKELSITYTP